MNISAPAGLWTSIWRRTVFAGAIVPALSITAVPLSVGAAVAPPPADDAPGVADDAGAKRGLAALVRINLPLVSGADMALKQSLSRARDRLVAAARVAADGRRPVLVLEIAPAEASNNGGAGSEFEPAYSLARFLAGRELADVKTVAWLPRTVRGHGVLVALACEEIVMAPDAELGEAGADEPEDRGGASDTVIAAYREIAGSKRIMPTALAQSMIDPSAEVVQVESAEGLRFLFREDVAEFRRSHEVIREQVLVPAGTFGRFTGREGRQFGFVKYLAADRGALAQALAAPVESLQEDQALMAEWQPIFMSVTGEVTARSASQFKTLLGNRLTGGVNWVGVRIDSVGGDLAACLDIAATLAALDPNAVRTVAYVPVEARGAAAVIALSCDQLVMHGDATIGVGPQHVVGPEPPANNRELPPQERRRRAPQPPADDEATRAAAVASIRDSLAPRTERPWSLLAAMIDPGIEIAAYRSKTSGEERLMSAEEVAVLPDSVNWTRGAPLVPNNEPLALNGVEAVSARVAWQTVANYDELERLYGVNDVEQVEPNWALTLVQALASPGLATFLLFLGFIGMYIEIKTPGVGIGGVVAAVAFILFFWSKYLNGTAESLEIVMFVAGIVLMLLEVFVVPGVGIFGLAGGLMVIFSLVLASQTFVVPRSQADMDRLRSSITVVAGAGLAMIGLAFATRRYLPKAPVFNRMVLEPPPPEDRITLSHREALADYSHLVGVTGEAATDLLPSGKALLNDQLIDVVAVGEPIDRGAPVVVVSAHATRVVVRRAT